MSVKKNYNTTLRSSILIASIRAEEAASDAMKSMLRTVKDNSKTLSNKSSSLSFKNKIDLLYDIEDLKKDDYTLCLRFMEIRNQFIHNPNCSYFVDLASELPDSIKFLNTNFSNEEVDLEKKLQKSFEMLWVKVMGKLLFLKHEYDEGKTEELIRFVDFKALEEIDEICKIAYSKWQEESQSSPITILFQKNDSETQFFNFERYFRESLNMKRIEIIDSIQEGNFEEKEVFARRKDIIAKLREKRNKDD